MSSLCGVIDRAVQISANLVRDRVPTSSFRTRSSSLLKELSPGYRGTHATSDIEGIRPIVPYLPWVSMAGRAFLAGYHRYIIHRQTSCVRRDNSQNINVSRLVLQFFYCAIHWSQVLSREWRCSWSSADGWRSNYIWVINDYIAYGVHLILKVWRYVHATNIRLYLLYSFAKSMAPTPIIFILCDLHPISSGFENYVLT